MNELSIMYQLLMGLVGVGMIVLTSKLLYHYVQSVLYYFNETLKVTQGDDDVNSN